MKTLKTLLLALVLGLAVINSGCVTSPTTGKQELDPVVAQGLAQDAAFLAAQTLKSQYGGELQLTLAALDAFVSTGTGDLAGLQRSLTNLPVSVLKGTNGTLVASGGAILVQQLGQLVLRLDKSGTTQKYVIPIATGLRDGLRQGLSAAVSKGPPSINWAMIHDTSSSYINSNLVAKVQARDGTNYLGVYLGMVAELDGSTSVYVPETNAQGNAVYCGKGRMVPNSKPQGVMMFSASSGEMLKWISYEDFRDIFVLKTKPEYAAVK